jgi:hypothetical protein
MQVSNAQKVDLKLNSGKKSGVPARRGAVCRADQCRCNRIEPKKLFAQYQKASGDAIFVAEQKDRC